MAFNFMGTGTSYVGRSSEPGDGTYVATDWIVLLWLPLLPLRSRRVTGVTKQRYMIRFLVFSFETADRIIGPAPLDRHVDPKYSRLLRQVVTYGLVISIFWGVFIWLVHLNESIGAWGMPAGLVFAVILYYVGRRLEPPGK
jgi:hypothetical protein